MSKGTIFAEKMADFLQKNANISKIKNVLVLKAIILKLHLCVYLRTKFQVFNIVLKSFRQEVILPTPHSPTAKWTPKKPT